MSFRISSVIRPAAPPEKALSLSSFRMFTVIRIIPVNLYHCNIFSGFEEKRISVLILIKNEGASVKQPSF